MNDINEMISELIDDPRLEDQPEAVRAIKLSLTLVKQTKDVYEAMTLCTCAVHEKLNVLQETVKATVTQSAIHASELIAEWLDGEKTQAEVLHEMVIWTRDTVEKHLGVRK